MSIVNVILLLCGLGLIFLGFFIIRSFTKPPPFRKVMARANWAGIPPEGLTWQEVVDQTSSSITPMTFEIGPRCCPECGKELLEYKSAPCYESDVKKGGSKEKIIQYDVSGLYCIMGHWTWLDFS